MLSASIVVFSIVHKEVVMEKKRKTLLFKGLTIIAILILGILVLSSCEQPGSVEDSSSQNKTSPSPSSVIDFNVQFEEVNYQAPEETELDSDTQSEEENDQQSEETALAEVGSDDSTEASVQVNDSDGTSALVNVDDNIVSVIVSVTPRIQGIELSAPSNSVEYDGSLDIKANLTPENAGPERLKWNLKYDNGSEVGENDGIRLIDNGDGTCTLVHEKINGGGFNVVVTAYTDDGISASCTINCRQGGNGVLDLATDVFIEQKYGISLPDSLNIPWGETREISATVNLDPGEKVISYEWSVEGKDVDSLQCLLLPFSATGEIKAKYRVTDGATVKVTATLNTGEKLESNVCSITTD